MKFQVEKTFSIRLDADDAQAIVEYLQPVVQDYIDNADDSNRGGECVSSLYLHLKKELES